MSDIESGQLELYNDVPVTPDENEQSDYVKEMCQEIKIGEEIISSMHNEWQRFLNYYKNYFFPGQIVEDKVVVNYIFAVIRSSIPRLFFKNPYIIINPKRLKTVAQAKIDTSKITSLEDLINVVNTGKTNIYDLNPTDRARILELVENQRWGELEVKDEMKECILDGKVFGTAWMKVGYTYKKEYSAKNRNKLIIDYAEHVTQEGMHVYRLSPYQVITPVGYNKLKRMPWITLKTIVPLREVQNTVGYKNLDDVKGEKILLNQPFVKTMAQGQQGNSRFMSDELFVRLYEKWDRRTGKITVVDGNGVELKQKKWELITDDFPVVQLKFIDVPDQLHGESIVKYIEGQNLELNRYRTKQLSHTEKFVRKYLADASKLTDEAEKTRLETGGDGTVVYVNGDPNNAVVPLQDAPLSSDERYFQEDCRQDIRIASGMDDVALGAGIRGSQTATEATISEKNKELRTDEEADAVADFAKKIARKMVQIDMQTLTGDQVAELTGEDGSKWKAVFNKERIRGEYDVDIQVGSMEAMTPEKRKQDLLLLNQVFQTPFAANFVNWPSLLTQIVRAFPWIKNPEDILNIAEDEREASRIYLREIELMAMGRLVEPRPEDNHELALKTVFGFLKAQEPDFITEQNAPAFDNYIKKHAALMQQIRGIQGSPPGGSQPAPFSPPTGTPPGTAQPNLPQVAEQPVESGQGAV